MEKLRLSSQQELLSGLGGLGAIPLSLQHDWQIRRAMTTAVQCDDVRVGEITKELQHQEDMTLLHAVPLQRPFCMPPAVVGADMGDLGADNATMRAFAFDAFEVLSEYFGHEAWGGWGIVPYFAEHDDTRGSFYLGVFVETVVE